MQKLRDGEDGPVVKKSLKDRNASAQLIAEIGGTEGDSLDLVEITMALEEAFDLASKKGAKS